MTPSFVRKKVQLKHEKFELVQSIIALQVKNKQSVIRVASVVFVPVKLIAVPKPINAHRVIVASTGVLVAEVIRIAKKEEMLVTN